MPNPVASKFLGVFVLNLQAEQCRILRVFFTFCQVIWHLQKPLSPLRLAFNDSCAELTVCTGVTMRTVTNDHSVCLSHMLSTDFSPCHRLSLRKGFWVFLSNLKCVGWAGLSIPAPLIFCCLEVSLSQQRASLGKCDLEWCEEQEEKSLWNYIYPVLMTHTVPMKYLNNLPFGASSARAEGRVQFYGKVWFY